MSKILATNVNELKLFPDSHNLTVKGQTEKTTGREFKFKVSTVDLCLTNY